MSTSRGDKEWDGYTDRDSEGEAVGEGEGTGGAKGEGEGEVVGAPAHRVPSSGSAPDPHPGKWLQARGCWCNASASTQKYSSWAVGATAAAAELQQAAHVNSKGPLKLREGGDKQLRGRMLAGEGDRRRGEGREGGRNEEKGRQT